MSIRRSPQRRRARSTDSRRRRRSPSRPHRETSISLRSVSPEKRSPSYDFDDPPNKAWNNPVTTHQSYDHHGGPSPRGYQTDQQQTWDDPRDRESWGKWQPTNPPHNATFNQKWWESHQRQETSTSKKSQPTARLMRPPSLITTNQNHHPSQPFRRISILNFQSLLLKERRRGSLIILRQLPNTNGRTDNNIGIVTLLPGSRHQYKKDMFVSTSRTTRNTTG